MNHPAGIDLVVEQETLPGGRQLGGPAGWAFRNGKSVWTLYDLNDKIRAYTDASSPELHEHAARAWCASGLSDGNAHKQG